MPQERQAINTFKKPPTCAQLVAYVIVISKCIIFTICIQNSFKDSTKRIAIIIFYYTSFLSLLLFWALTSRRDPTDPYLYESLSKFGKKSKEAILYCQKCKSFVQQSSLHCKLCNRCIVGFDHHCVWINNCIGSNNYKIFIAMIISALINLALFQVGIAMLWGQGQWNYFLEKMIVSWIAGVVVAVFCTLLFVLVSFHLYLVYKGKTTYEFLMEDKLKKVMPDNPQQSIKQSKIARITPEINNSKVSAVDYHKNGLVFQINQSDQCSQSKSNSHLEMKKEGENQRNESEQSPSQTQEQNAIRRNKSFDFLIGRCDVERQARAFESTFKSLHQRKNSRLITEDIGGQTIKRNNLPKLTVTITLNK